MKYDYIFDWNVLKVKTDEFHDIKQQTGNEEAKSDNGPEVGGDDLLFGAEEARKTEGSKKDGSKVIKDAADILDF